PLISRWVLVARNSNTPRLEAVGRVTVPVAPVHGRGADVGQVYPGLSKWPVKVTQHSIPRVIVVQAAQFGGKALLIDRVDHLALSDAGQRHVADLNDTGHGNPLKKKAPAGAWKGVGNQASGKSLSWSVRSGSPALRRVASASA